MLEYFRNAGKSWIAKVFLALLILSFAIFGIEDMFANVGSYFARLSGFGPQDLAKVGGEVISSERYRRDLNEELQTLSRQFGTNLSIEDARNLGIDQRVFDRLVNTTAVDDQARRLNLAVSDKAIATEFASNPRFQNSKGEFDPARFRRALENAGMNEETFLALERAGRMRAALTGVAGDGVVLPKVLKDAMLQFRNETRDGRYFVFKVSEADVPAPTDADLKAQYDATPAAYTAPDYRSIAIIKVEAADLAERIQVSEDEIKAGYEKFKEDYYTPEKRTVLQVTFPDIAKAEAARKRIESGEDFVKVAVDSGAKAEDVTLVDRVKGDFLDAKVAEAAFSLAEGALSSPVQGDLAVALLKVVKVAKESQKTLEDVRPEIARRLQLERAQDELQAVYDAVEEARAERTKFEDIAAKAGIPFTLIPAVTQGGLDRAGQPVSIPGQVDVLKAAFASDVGVENDALALQDGYAWFEVREVIPSALKPFAEVKEAVTKDFIASRLRTLASEKAKAIVERAGTTTKLDTLAAEAGAEIKTVTGVKRTDSSETFDGVATLALFSVPQGSLTWALEPDGLGARIIEVSAVSQPAAGDLSPEAKEVLDTTKTGLGADLVANFLKASRKAANVEVNEELWKTIRGSSTGQP